jgi:AcrR family transcriptional regulator
MSTTEYPLPSLTRPGRIRDGQRTRTAILKAAQTAFSTHGYASAGIREIAGIAGVNSALVRRYYGSKEMLFEAALGSMLDVGHLLVADRGTFGAFAVRFFVGHGEDTPNPVPMLTLAGGDPIARRVAMRLFDHQVLAPFERWLGPPDAAARAAAIHVLLIGFFSYWRLLPSWPSRASQRPASRPARPSREPAGHPPRLTAHLR